MARWTDLAVWLGPTPNQSGRMVEQRGVIVHIAEGSFDGTIGWQLNPASDVSSHFVVDYDGRIAQMVDTDTTAWTQAAGNGHWLSIENAGFHTGALTAEQIEANAQLLARAHREYGVPLQLAGDPSGYGLGWHGMGGDAWGSHPNCPGANNVALLPTILARAIQIINGTEEDDDMLTAIQTSDVNGDVILMFPWNGTWRRVPRSDNPWILNNSLVALDLAGVKVNAATWPGPYDFSDPATWAWAGFEVKPEGAITFPPEALAAVAEAARAGAEAGAPTHDELVAAAQEGAERAEDA